VHWKNLPEPARTIGTTVTRAVEAAAQHNSGDFTAAAEMLAHLDFDHAGSVLADLVRTLLEEGHPDGVDSDDIQAVLAECLRVSTTWLPAGRVDPYVLVAVVAGALGIQEPGLTYSDPTEGPAGTTAPVTLTAEAFGLHSPLLIASMLTGAPRRLDDYLDDVFTDLAQTQTMNLP
jgi:hypothetical protein